jgi:aspartate dehydrogenase
MAPIRIAIAGFGTIGREVARRLDRGDVPGLVLTAVAARDREKAERNAAALASPPKVVAIAELPAHADVVVECAPSRHFGEVARATLEAGRTLVPLSVGALLDHIDLVEVARAKGGRILVPTGALLGLDAVRAVSEGTVHSVEIVTRKPPAGLAGAPLVVQRGIDVTALREPLLLFEGSAREAIKGFPANVNVAVALSLAGIGADRTRIQIWADPGVRHNKHTIQVRSDTSDLTMTVENTPTTENPATGKVVAPSVIALLRRLTAPMVVGT